MAERRARPVTAATAAAAGRERPRRRDGSGGAGEAAGARDGSGGAGEAAGARDGGGEAAGEAAGARDGGGERDAAAAAAAVLEPGDEMAAAKPWDEGQPTAAGAALARCLEAGVVSQETLDLLCPRAPCFVKFSERERIASLQAEINQKKMEIEILELEKETADITHPFYLNQKYQILQDMNNHLEAVLKEKRSLRQRLIKPRCQDSLPIEAPFHKYIVELLTEAVNFIEKLERHLQTVRSVPQIPTLMKNMDTALTKTEMLVRDLEELTEQIVKWREVQKEVHSDSICSPGEFDFSLSLT